MKYKKVTKEDVYDTIKYFCKTVWQMNICQPSFIAKYLETSRYQVDKYIKQLKEENKIKYDNFTLPKEDQYDLIDSLPIWGYNLVEKVKLFKE